MDLCNVILVPSTLGGKNLNVGHYALTFQPHSSTPASLVSTSDLCHFVTLTLDDGHKVSKKQNLSTSLYAAGHKVSKAHSVGFIFSRFSTNYDEI